MVSEVSILIPVYNFNIQSLVKSLWAQCQAPNLTFEIICLDDDSDEHFKILNRAIAHLPHVFYYELPQRVSRAAIRNILGHRSKYAYLLFIDNDSEIISPDFILNYLRRARPEQVLIGGTVYTTKLPAPEYTLHWLVGRNREQRPASIRNRHPYQSVQVNNALVPRAIWHEHPFDEKIQGYGHEDSQWAKRLEQARVGVLHLNNPVNHLGLETAPGFLRKTDQGVRNLHYLYFTERVGAGTPLIRWYLRFKNLRLLGAFYFFYQGLKPALRYNLHSKHPRLSCFDLYKLGIFIQAVRETKKQ